MALVVLTFNYRYSNVRSLCKATEDIEAYISTAPVVSQHTDSGIHSDFSWYTYSLRLSPSGCDAVYCGRYWPVIQRYLLPSSGWKIICTNIAEEYAAPVLVYLEDGGISFNRNSDFIFYFPFFFYQTTGSHIPEVMFTAFRTSALTYFTRLKWSDFTCTVSVLLNVTAPNVLVCW
jgi:hypothetical protein